MRTVVLDAYQGWIDFWQKFADFFWVQDDRGLNYLSRIGIAIAIIVFGWLVIKFIGFVLKKAFRIKRSPEIDASAKFFAVEIIKIMLWIGIAFAVSSILKFDLTGLAGITSAVAVALGLALQDLIGSFFSGLLIINQKSIRTGDYILVKNAFGECEGEVERVHFFITYLRTFKGQRVIVPNKNMTSAVITNFTVLGERRCDYDVGVAYDTDIAVAKEALLSVIKDEKVIINPEKTMVYVESLGAYSVNLRLRYWTKVEDYWPLYYQIPERVLLAFREKGINIPSSTDLHINK